MPDAKIWNRQFKGGCTVEWTNYTVLGQALFDPCDDASRKTVRLPEPACSGFTVRIGRVTLLQGSDFELRFDTLHFYHELHPNSCLAIMGTPQIGGLVAKVYGKTEFMLICMELGDVLHTLRKNKVGETNTQDRYALDVLGDCIRRLKEMP